MAILYTAYNIISKMHAETLLGLPSIILESSEMPKQMLLVQAQLGPLVCVKESGKSQTS